MLSAEKLKSLAEQQVFVGTSRLEAFNQSARICAL
jgi:hypothetical protein